MLAMQQEAPMAMAMDDDGDDLLVRGRRAVPPFPWDVLRELITLGGEYAGDTSAHPVPITTRNLIGMRWQSFEHPERALAGTAIARAFDGGNGKTMSAAHFNIFMATEVGMVPRPDRKGVLRWCIYRPDYPNAVMPDHEAAATFGISSDRIARYRREAKRAVEREWEWLHSGWER
jgi:hypothetical protein